eukprot:1591421-Pyramimonas_sp.AAC.1
MACKEGEYTRIGDQRRVGRGNIPESGTNGGIREGVYTSRVACAMFPCSARVPVLSPMSDAGPMACREGEYTRSRDQWRDQGGGIYLARGLRDVPVQRARAGALPDERRHLVRLRLALHKHDGAPGLASTVAPHQVHHNLTVLGPVARQAQ